MRTAFFFIVLFLGIKAYAGASDTTITGKTKNGGRIGTWRYYDASHHIVKLERYRHGSLRQTYIYNAGGRVIQRINKNGRVTHYKGCGC
jgi:hypothetical protein